MFVPFLTPLVLNVKVVVMSASFISVLLNIILISLLEKLFLVVSSIKVIVSFPD